jgi:hypothetical protein
VKQQHLLDLYYPEFDLNKYEDTESNYYRKHRNKFKEDRIQSLYDNYKRDNKGESPPRTKYNDKIELCKVIKN